MNKLSLILLFSLFWSCNNRTANSIILETIPLGLTGFLNDENVVLINIGLIENGYFLKNLIKIKGDTLRNSSELNNELLNQFLQSVDSSFYVNTQNLKVVNWTFHITNQKLTLF